MHARLCASFASTALIALGAVVLVPGQSLADSQAANATAPPPPMRLTRIDSGISVSSDADANPSTELEALMMALSSGSASVTADVVLVRGIVTDPSGWEAALVLARAGLPPEQTIETNVYVIETSKPVALLCREMFIASTRQPIRFQTAGNILRTSSYGALDRLIEFAADCPDTAITITGHSDAMGDPVFNLDLSERRAQSVANYLVSGGVAEDRLTVVGAGATEPVADNETSYGRRQNRRIEFALVTPTAPD